LGLDLTFNCPAFAPVSPGVLATNGPGNMTHSNKHVEHLRVAVTAFVKNRDDFSKVTLALARKLWRARQAFRGDDTAFRAWLAVHRLTDKIRPHDRAALIKLGEHAKVAARVLRQTSSRSVRLIWINEVRPLVEPERTYASAGKRQIAMRVTSPMPETRKITMRTTTTVLQFRPHIKILETRPLLPPLPKNWLQIVEARPLLPPLHKDAVQILEPRPLPPPPAGAKPDRKRPRGRPR
jgi:hypothetical protein